MNDKLFDYYNKELVAIRELAKEFAARYPKVAARLDMHDTEISDPYVERLLEGVSFLTARTQLKIDAEYPRFVQRIMEVLYPQFLTQTPSSAIVTMAVSQKQTLNVLHQVNRQQLLNSLPLKEINDHISCQYAVTRALELTPLQITSAVYTQSLGYLPKSLQLNRKAVEYSALRLDFALAIDGLCSDLIPEQLPIYLGAELAKSSQLLYLMLNHCDKVVCHSFENPQAWYQELDSLPKQLGFAEDEALSFNLNKNVAALRVIQEYIQLPEKFLFVEQTGVKAAIKRSEQQGCFPIVLSKLKKSSAKTGSINALLALKNATLVSPLFSTNKLTA
ncbi:type VI secretion system baseplate subunit TssF [Faucicola atlantae]|uniref:type VI secretion system baseplate subunit TssF n=1 Tax=Faucicola atlantae TaxID=34059 RepID=UPI0025AFEFA1|nr:type VI secretion system baseplate subunit TssF [Moraxella atlantae]